MNVIKMRPRGEPLEALEITRDLASRSSEWPEWLSKAWRDSQPIEDGSLKPNIVVPDEIEAGSIRVGLHTHVEVGRPGDYLIRLASGNIGIATAGYLFAEYEPMDGSAEPVDKRILSAADGGPGSEAGQPAAPQDPGPAVME